MPNSGLDIKNRTWLKIPIPMSFLGTVIKRSIVSCRSSLARRIGKDLLDWLLAHVDGLLERKDARKYAAELLKRKLIAHVVNKITFTEQCYYVLGEECAGADPLPEAPRPCHYMSLLQISHVTGLILRTWWRTSTADSSSGCSGAAEPPAVRRRRPRW